MTEYGTSIHCSAYRNIPNLCQISKSLSFRCQICLNLSKLSLSCDEPIIICHTYATMQRHWQLAFTLQRRETSHFGYARVKIRKSCQRSQNCDSTSLRWIKLKQNATFAPQELKLASYQRIPNGTQPCKHKMIDPSAGLP